MEKKVILLTGATGGLGRELARLLQPNYRLALHYLQGEKLLEESADCSYFQADMRNETEIITMVDEVIQHFGKIDVLINNAGVSHSAMTWKTESEAWKNTLAINLDAPFYLSKAVIPHLRAQKGGSIINVSSVVAQTGYVGTSAYAASKAGLIGLTKSMSKELAYFQINVNVLALGYFNQGMISTVPEDQLDEIVKQIPMNRLGEPDLIVKTVEWLTSAEGAYVTGQTINLNGGLYS
jgi:NAD(P)-dependent dehydrogenase (short-subunit alcohol dehydrogenase family)